MPRIREYTSQESSRVKPGGRRAQASDFGDGSGLLTMGKAIEGVGDIIQDNVERQEVSDVRAKLARARADWTVALEERATAAPVGDPTFASKFNDDFAAHLDKLGGNIQTRSGEAAFRQGAGELSAHFVQASGRYQAHSAGLKARHDYTVFLDSSRNALISDPTQFSSVLRDTENTLNDPSGPYARMSAEDREKLANQTKRELALSTVQGTIRLSPELAFKQLNGGQWDQYLDADRKHFLLQNTQVALRARESAEERVRLETERAHKAAQKTTMDGFLARIVDPRNNGGPLSDREIISDTVLDPLQKQHMIDYKLRRARELAASHESKTNPAEVRALMLRIHASYGDPAKTYNTEPVMESYRAGRISTTEMRMLRTEIEQLRDGNTQGFQKDVQSARNAVYSALTRSTIGQVQPEVAADAAYRWSRDLEIAVERKRKANEDPRALLTPGHKDYMLAPQIIASYMKRPGEVLADEAEKARDPRRTVSGRIGGAKVLPTYRDFDKIKSGDEFTDPQGNVRRKK